MKKLIMDSISKSYAGKTILSDIDLCLHENECLGIMGESGSGKSTLARLATCLEKCDKGDIIFDGISYTKAEKKEVKTIHRKIQLVFQNASGSVNPRYTVEQVLTEPLKIHYRKELSYAEMKFKAETLLKRVGLESEYMSVKAVNLSGGQLQRICIARALILKPDIIIFDESLSGLDPLIQRQILQLLGDLKESMNLSYVFISHDFETCYYLCDRVIIIEKGKIVDTIDDLDSPIVIKNERMRQILGNAVKYFKTVNLT